MITRQRSALIGEAIGKGPTSPAFRQISTNSASKRQRVSMTAGDSPLSTDNWKRTKAAGSRKQEKDTQDKEALARLRKSSKSMLIVGKVESAGKDLRIEQAKHEEQESMPPSGGRTRPKTNKKPIVVQSTSTSSTNSVAESVLASERPLESRSRKRKPVTAIANANNAPAANEQLRGDALKVLAALKTRRALAEEKAPVDSFGPHILSQQAGSEGDRAFQILIAVMLSSQTKDTLLGPIVQKLQTTGNRHGVGLCLERIRNETEDSLAELIKPVSFFKTKAKNILKTCDMIVAKHGGNVPNDVGAVLEFPGVGPKMAHILMEDAFGVTAGIAVDTHVHRISNRLGWVDTWNSKSNAPEKTRKQLEELFDIENWREVNINLVAFGQTLCNAKQPKCEQCPIQQYCKKPNLDS